MGSRRWDDSWTHGGMDARKDRKHNIVCAFCQIQNPGSSHMKKMQPVEEENERCALLAAIRAQSNYGRLRKVKRPQSHYKSRPRKAAV